MVSMVARIASPSVPRARLFLATHSCYPSPWRHPTASISQRDRYLRHTTLTISYKQCCCENSQPQDYDHAVVAEPPAEFTAQSLPLCCSHDDPDCCFFIKPIAPEAAAVNLAAANGDFRGWAGTGSTHGRL